MSKKIDEITLSILQHRLSSIAKEMTIAMKRSSRSSIFAEVGDFVCSVFDWKTQVLAQEEGEATLVGAIPFACKSVAEYFKDDVAPGDIMLLNDPYMGNNHIPDFTMFAPVFYKNELLFWAGNKAHQLDTGAASPGGYAPYATDIFQEGIKIPPLKIYDKGVLRRDVFDMILRNVRLQDTMRGDLRAMIGSVRVGEKRLIELVEAYGVSDVKNLTQEIVDRTEEFMRGLIRKLPEGVYNGRSQLDDDAFTGVTYDIEPRPPTQRVEKGPPVEICLAVTVKNGSIVVDFTGTSKQTKGFINSSLANTWSGVMIGVLTSVDPLGKIPHNWGCYRRIKIIAPVGTLVNPIWPAATSECTLETSDAIVDAVWDALGKAVPENVSASWPRTACPVASGVDPRTGDGYAFIYLYSLSGAGAIWGMDGQPGLGCNVTLGCMTYQNVEAFELAFPYMVTEYYMKKDTGGPGKWRGSPGLVTKFKPLNHDAVMVQYGDGVKTPAMGRSGGLPSPQLNEIRIIAKDNKSYYLPGKYFAAIYDGETWACDSQGGGGVGDPTERDVDAVVDDVKNDLVSLEHARAIYGVVVDPRTCKNSTLATARLRKERKAKRKAGRKQ